MKICTYGDHLTLFAQMVANSIALADTIAMRLLKELNVFEKKVLIRADLDVDVTAIDKPSELIRLKNLKETVDYLLTNGALQIIIAGHIGRPSIEKASVESASGKPLFYNPMETTEQLVKPLSDILGQPVVFCQDFGHLGEDKIILFENLRFWPGETKKDPVFANKISFLGQLYVNESFANCHRDHASMALVPSLMPSAAGLHLQKEVEQLSRLISTPQRPFVAVVGGAKAETKIPVITNLAKIADSVLVGGALVKEIQNDGSAIKSFNNVTVGSLTPDGEDLDDVTITQFVSALSTAQTVIWNGPMGHFETGFEKGTLVVADAIIKSGANSIVGGGETTTFLESKSLLPKFTFISSGGGAMLAFLAGEQMPGIEALG